MHIRTLVSWYHWGPDHEFPACGFDVCVADSRVVDLYECFIWTYGIEFDTF